MKFGYGLITGQQYPGDPRSDADLYREALLLAEDAERLGFDSVWTSEHHFWNDAYTPSLMPLCAALAARTSRVQIGTAVLLAPLYEPIRLAEDAAVVDLIAEGRLLLGIGAGWREEEFETLRVPLSERGPRIVDTVATLRQAWAGEPVVGGETVSYPGVRVTPRPPTPTGPPVWVGAGAKGAVKRAGRLGDGYIGNFQAPPELFAQQCAWVREGIAERPAGDRRDPAAFSYAIQLPTFVWDGPDAWEHVRDHYRYVFWKYDAMVDARRGRLPLEEPPPWTPAEEEEARRKIVVGTPDEVAAQIRRYEEAAGGGLHYVSRMLWPGMDLERQRESLRVFAEEVIPRIRSNQP